MWMTLWLQTALAQHVSVPKELYFEDEVGVLDGLQADTAWFPSENSALAIRLFLDTTGGLTTSLEAASELEWSDSEPGPLFHRVAGYAEGGVVSLDATAEVGAEVKIDVGGVFTGTVPLLRQSATWLDVASFDGLLLTGGQETVTVGDGLRPQGLSFRISVVAGVDLVVGVDVVPELQAEVAGVDVRTRGLGAEVVQEVEGDWGELPPDPQRPGEVGLTSTWSAQISSDVALKLVPSLDLFTPVGGFTVASFDVPIPLASHQETRDFEVFYVHPLPVLQGPFDGYDFGEVPLGTASSWEVPLGNLGALDVTGHVEVIGASSFSVFPADVAVLVDGEDGVVLTFAPVEPGPVEGVLRLVTNDPLQPVIEIDVRGLGLEPDSGGGAASTPVTMCGCSTPSRPSSVAVALLLLALLARRQ